LPQYQRSPEQLQNILCGGYILHQEENDSLDAVIIATGSEIQLAMNAASKAAQNGHQVRVVSMPCLDIFELQPETYQYCVVPEGFEKVMIIEASKASGWSQYRSPKGIVIGMDSFGKSAPAPELFEHFGFSDDNVYQQLMTMIEK
jgi:transketolase